MVYFTSANNQKVVERLSKLKSGNDFMHPFHEHPLCMQPARTTWRCLSQDHATIPCHSGLHFPGELAAHCSLCNVYMCSKCVQAAPEYGGIGDDSLPTVVRLVAKDADAPGSTMTLPCARLRVRADDDSPPERRAGAEPAGASAAPSGPVARQQEGLINSAAAPLLRLWEETECMVSAVPPAAPPLAAAGFQPRIIVDNALLSSSSLGHINVTLPVQSWLDAHATISANQCAALAEAGGGATLVIRWHTVTDATEHQCVLSGDKSLVAPAVQTMPKCPYCRTKHSSLPLHCFLQHAVSKI